MFLNCLTKLAGSVLIYCNLVSVTDRFIGKNFCTYILENVLVLTLSLVYTVPFEILLWSLSDNSFDKFELNRFEVFALIFELCFLVLYFLLMGFDPCLLTLDACLLTLDPYLLILDSYLLTFVASGDFAVFTILII